MSPTAGAALSREQQNAEVRAFHDWAWRKEGAPIGHLDGQAAGREAWLARAALSPIETTAVVPISDEQIEANPVWQPFIGLTREHKIEIARAILATRSKP